ncbi:malate dehydrogenase [Candidatus Bathyarchaeota archaeon]|nr:MAG: malate dehydrogenase [Candidatus Bathyarchaeota archaeon]
MVDLGLHIAIIGTGRVGRPTAYSILQEGLADELSLVDVKPGLAWAFGEELRHAAASLRYDVEINAYERDEDLSGADLIVVTAGIPRTPGVKMSRRDLAAKNAEIIRYIAEVVPPRNPGARFVIVTNPVDAMATLFRHYSKADFVISTGNHAETIRFRSKLARDLRVGVSKIEGFVGGEHGAAATVLWSTVRVSGLRPEEYASSKGLELDREGVEEYVKTISKRVVDIIGGTEYGPAAAFRDIVRAIALNRDEVLSIAAPVRLEGVPEVVNVSIPTRLGMTIGPNFLGELTEEERSRIVAAGKAIYSTYEMSLRAVE